MKTQTSPSTGVSIAILIVGIGLIVNTVLDQQARSLASAAFNDASKARAEVFTALHPPLPEPSPTPDLLPKS